MLRKEKVSNTVCQNPGTSLGVVGSQHQLKQRDMNAGMASHVISREALLPGTLLPQEDVVYMTMKNKERAKRRKFNILQKQKRKKLVSCSSLPSFLF